MAKLTLPSLKNVKGDKPSWFHRARIPAWLLVAFARRPYLICPLMNGTAILEERMEQITTDDFEDGTAIGDAINLAVRSLKTADGPKAIVLLSDGVDHSQDDKAPLLAAEAAAKAAIVIHTVGIGGKHAYHPVNTDGGTEWRPVGEELNEPQLTEIARLTNGQYVKAGDADALSKAIETLAEQVIAQPRTTARRVSVPLTPLLLVAALLAVASLVSRLLLHAYF